MGLPIPRMQELEIHIDERALQEKLSEILAADFFQKAVAYARQKKRSAYTSCCNLNPHSLSFPYLCRHRYDNGNDYRPDNNVSDQGWQVGPPWKVLWRQYEAN